MPNMKAWLETLAVVFFDGALAGVVPLLATGAKWDADHLHMAGAAALVGGLTSVYRWRQQGPKAATSEKAE